MHTAVPAAAAARAASYAAASWRLHAARLTVDHHGQLCPSEINRDVDDRGAGDEA